MASPLSIEVDLRLLYSKINKLVNDYKKLKYKIKDVPMGRYILARSYYSIQKKD